MDYLFSFIPGAYKNLNTPLFLADMALFLVYRMYDVYRSLCIECTMCIGIRCFASCCVSFAVGIVSSIFDVWLFHTNH